MYQSWSQKQRCLQIKLDTPRPIWTVKISNLEHVQYSRGRPAWNSMWGTICFVFVVLQMQKHRKVDDGCTMRAQWSLFDWRSLVDLLQTWLCLLLVRMDRIQTERHLLRDQHAPSTPSAPCVGEQLLSQSARFSCKIIRYWIMWVYMYKTTF